MMHQKKTLTRGLTSLLLGGAIVAASGAAVTAVAQDAQPEKTKVTKRSVSSGRDPFKRYEPPRPTMVKRIAGQANVPSIQERISQYKAQKLAAMNARMTAPKPTTALLLSEIQV